MLSAIALSYESPVLPVDASCQRRMKSAPFVTATPDVRTYAPDTENSGSPLTTRLQRCEKPESVLAAHTAIPQVSTSTPVTNSLLRTSAPRPDYPGSANRVQSLRQDEMPGTSPC